MTRTIRRPIYNRLTEIERLAVDLAVLDGEWQIIENSGENDVGDKMRLNAQVGPQRSTSGSVPATNTQPLGVRRRD